MNKTGFLSPSGKLIECESYEHLDKACEIADELNLSYNNRLEAEIILQKLGYITVRARDVYGLIGYLDDNYKLICMTTEQKRWLERNYEFFPKDKQKSVDDLIDHCG